MVGGEGEAGGGTHADADDMAAGGAQPFPHGLVEGGRGEAVVAAEGDSRPVGASEVGSERLAEDPDSVRRQVLINDAADVVFAKNLGVE